MLLKEIFLLELRYEDLPNTEYGYWIEESGRLLPVDEEEHADVAERELSRVYPLDDDPYDEAYDRGWIRLIFNPREASTIDIEFGIKVTRKAKQTLAYLLRMFKDELQNIFIDSPKASKSFRIAPMAAGQAINWINQH